MRRFSRLTFAVLAVAMCGIPLIAQTDQRGAPRQGRQPACSIGVGY